MWPCAFATTSPTGPHGTAMTASVDASSENGDTQTFYAQELAGLSDEIQSLTRDLQRFMLTCARSKEKVDI